MLEFEDIMDDAVRYLKGEMDADERAFFEDLLEQFPHLKEELHFFKLVQLGAGKLRENPDISSASRKKRKRWSSGYLVPGLIMLCLLFAIIIVLFKWGFQKDNIEASNSHPIINLADAVLENRLSSNDKQTLLIKQINSGPDLGHGLSISWVSPTELAFAAFFEGTASLGPVTISGKGKTDMLFGVFDIAQGYQWIGSVGSKDYIDLPRAIRTDRENNIILAGSFGGQVDFGGRIIQAIGQDDRGNCDFFVAKYDKQGTLAWVDHSGGKIIPDIQTGVNISQAIATDLQNNIIVCGHYIGQPQVAGFKLPEGGANEDVFLVKYAENGVPAWVKTITSDFMVYGKGMDTDQEGNIYLTGTFGHHNLGGKAFFEDDTLRSFGGRDVFLAKFNSKGDLLWVRQAGSSVSKDGYDEATGIVVDYNGDIVVTGQFVGEAIFGSKTITSYGGRDIFIAKYNTEGQLIWIEKAGSREGDGKHHELATGIATDPLGNIYLTGSFTDTAYFNNQELLSTTGNYNFFLAKYTTQGKVVWVRQFDPQSGFISAEGTAIAINERNQIAVTGSFSGNIAIDNQQLKSRGKGDVFITVFNNDGQVMSINHMIAAHRDLLPDTSIPNRSF